MPDSALLKLLKLLKFLKFPTNSSLSIKGLSLECYALAIGSYEYHAALGACYVTYDIDKA